MTANCEQFCTKQECGELSLRLSIAEAKISDLSNLISKLQQQIDALQQHIEILEASFEAHTNQDIPQAHNYDLTVDVSLAVDSSSNTLKVFVKVNDANDSETVNLPEYETNTDDFCTKDECGELYQSIQLLKASFEAHTNQDIPEAHNYEPNENDDFKIDNKFKNKLNNYFNDYFNNIIDDFCTKDECGELYQSIQLLEASFEAHTNQDIPQAHNYDLTVDVSLDVDSSSNTLKVFVKVNHANDSETVTLPEYEINTDDFCTKDECGELYQSIQLLEASFEAHTQQHIPEAHNYENACDNSNLTINGSYFDGNLNITVAHCNDFDSVDIQIDMENCCNEILTKLQTIEDYVTVNISGTLSGDFDCQQPLKDDGSIDDFAFPEAIASSKNYGDQGISGLHKMLQIFGENLDKIYANTCKAIEPLANLTVEDVYKYCSDGNLIKRSDYSDTEMGQAEYEQALADQLTINFANSKYGHLINDDGIITPITAPNYVISRLLSDFTLIQAKNNHDLLCNINNAEPQDVVAIVASEKDLHRVKTKVLILHFVLLDVYPKRSASDTLWQVQIPAAKDSYSWLNDFDGLRRTHGNQYAELQFNENYVPVSGWFASEAAAETFFDAVLELTNATEKNRVFPKHKTPQINIAVATTRPYRAFIKSINNQGRPVCHAKYVPVINE
jgi:uncharacterized coiled-coil protein SlyX